MWSWYSCQVEALNKLDNIYSTHLFNFSIFLHLSVKLMRPCVSCYPILANVSHSQSQETQITLLIILIQLRPPGIKVTYDLRQPNGQRVKELQVRVSGNEYASIEPERAYKIAVSSYLARGGDGFNIIPQKMRKHINLGGLIHLNSGI